jgi:hypothetical protein
MEDDALDKIAKEIIANEAGIKSFDQLINEFETDMLKGLSKSDAADFANWYLDSGFDKEGKARAWLNENTDRLADPRMVDDDTSFAMEQQGFDEVAETNKAFEQELTNTNDPLNDFDGPAYDAQTMDRDIPNQIDEDYAKLLQENSIVDGDIVDMDDIDKPITDVDNYLNNNLADNVIKSLAIGGLNMLDAYELGLIGAALIEPAVQKALKPIMPLIFPGYKGKVDSKTYSEQVIENLQATAKISPTAKAAEKIASMPKQEEYNSYSWVGKMLDR